MKKMKIFLIYFNFTMFIFIDRCFYQNVCDVVIDLFFCFYKCLVSIKLLWNVLNIYINNGNKDNINTERQWIVERFIFYFYYLIKSHSFLWNDLKRTKTTATHLAIEQTHKDTQSSQTESIQRFLYKKLRCNNLRVSTGFLRSWLIYL